MTEKKAKEPLHWERAQERWQALRDAAHKVLVAWEEWERGKEVGGDTRAQAVAMLGWHLGALEGFLMRLQDEAATQRRPARERKAKP